MLHCEFCKEHVQQNGIQLIELNKLTDTKGSFIKGE